MSMKKMVRYFFCITSLRVLRLLRGLCLRAVKLLLDLFFENPFDHFTRSRERKLIDEYYPPWNLVARQLTRAELIDLISCDCVARAHDDHSYRHLTPLV